MHFINKLIKRGIFGLLVVFSFFVFGNDIKVEAATCSISLNDGNDYLVVNHALGWTDSGVTLTCDGSSNKNVTVRINNSTPQPTTNSGVGVANGLNVGFYNIKYYMTADPSVMVTRQIRVLPNSLNESTNFWLGESEPVSTENDDAFNRVVSAGVEDVGYLAVGNFDKAGYIVAYNLRGEYLWHSAFGAGTYNTDVEVTALRINSIVSGDKSDKTVYYIVGEYTTASKTEAFIRKIILNGDGTGISDADENFYSVNEMTSISEIVVAGNYVVVSGYKENEYGTRSGVISRFEVSGGLFGSPSYYKKSVESEFNSIIAFTESSAWKIVAVGSTEVSGYIGAKGGSVVKCDVYEFSCVEQIPYFYLNNNKATTTITEFSDVVSHGTGYVVVGQSRIDKVVGSTTIDNAGVEDSIVVLLDSTFKTLDVKLLGGGSEDGLKTITPIDNDNQKFVAVGNRGAYGNYVSIDISEGFIEFSERNLSGNNTILNDVMVNLFADEERQYILVGSTGASSIESVGFVNAGGKDSLFALIDDTMYSNFGDITVYQNAVICEDGVSKSCSVENLSASYNLKYGTREETFSKGSEVDVVISSENVGTYELYHKFENAQGVIIMIGRKMYVKQSIVAPDLTTQNMGIDRWYLYSRTENVDGVGSREVTWDEYYYPVADHVRKETGVTYYKFSLTTLSFEVDTSGKEETSQNYIKLAQEPTNSLVAFQSKENAEKFALVQEFSRIALVKSNFFDVNKDYVSKIKYFSNEQINLSYQNYFFVYYADMKVSNEAECVARNNKLYGTCTNYYGYAFSDVKTIKNLIENLIVANEYFVSEQNNKFNPSSSVGHPVSDQFKMEEVHTVEHKKTHSVNLAAGLTLEVKYYKPLGDSVVGYTGFDSEADITPISGQEKVDFSSSGDFKEEGKYEIRYCYNYKGDDSISDQVCGSSAGFVIDRTAPIVNYSLLGGGVGQMKESTTNGKQKTTTTVTSMVDIDEYAYTIYEGQKYFLKCNAKVNSAMCIADLQVAVKRVFEYDPKEPNKEFSLVVIDRAGNELNVKFILGTANPLVNIIDEDTLDDSFVLDIDFYNKNKVMDVAVKYIASEEADHPAVEKDIELAIEKYLSAIAYHNEQEYQKFKADSAYVPVYIEELWNLATCDPLNVTENCSLLTFNRTFDVEGDSENGYVIKNGLAVPVFDETDKGETVLKRNGTNSGYEYEYLPISKGLYRITIGDSFNNFVEDCGGISLGKAELYTYIEQDDGYEEYVEISGNKVNIFEAAAYNYEMYRDLIKVPFESAENIPSYAFFATEPSTYSYFETLPVSLHSGFDEKMYFTNQFVYIKFAVNGFSGLTISMANGLNKVGSYVDENIKHLTCQFAFYGSDVPLALTGLPSCAEKFVFDNIEDDNVKTALSAEGIYFAGKSQVEEDGNITTYYYIAFTKDGTYEISSDINPNFNGVEFAHVSVPAKYSFSIDSVNPNVEFSVVCESGKTCKGDKGSYSDIKDFVFEAGSKNLTNIGNHNMKLILNNDVFTYTNALGQVTTVENRLLVVKIDGELHNAYDYSLKNSDPLEGNYILFTENGTYEITFYDAGRNQITYKFVIDKSSPTVEHNGSGFDGYQKYVNVTVNISEDSALTLVSSVSVSELDGDDYTSYVDVNACGNDMECVLYKLYTDNGALFDSNHAFYSFVDGGYVLLGATDAIDPAETYYYDSKENTLNIEYWKSSSDAKNSVGIVKTALGECYVGTGSGSISNFNCQVVDIGGGAQSISLSFTISINDTASPKSDVQTFTIKAYDYFGNGYEASHSFYFDNLSPYISFNGYIPTTKFGESIVDSDEKDKWLNADDGASTGIFTCGGDVLGKGNIISCNDTPEIEGKENGVKVHSFEAARMAYNNYEVSINGTFEPVNNGKMMDNETQLYKAKYVEFTSSAQFERMVNGGETIYSQDDYFALMESYNYIDPTVTYYYDVSGVKTAVSIIDMYTNASSYTGYSNIAACGTDYKCALYILYVDSGKFTDSTYRFYELEEDAFVEVTRSITNFSNYSGYYYVSEYVRDEGKYLPALTSDNSCVVIDQSGSSFVCSPVIEGRVKISDGNHVYYNIVSKSLRGPTAVQSLIVRGAAKSGVVDKTVWQIAMDNGQEVIFGFGIKSDFGRPIIFRAVDGAGNIGSNHIETVIRIVDRVSPVAVGVSSISYVKDETPGLTKDNYILAPEVYYKVPKGGECVLDKYYTYSAGVYSLVDDCGLWDVNERHYIKVENSYVKVEDGQAKDFGAYTYYKAELSGSSNWDGMYITDKDIVITFSEPIHRVECSYYLHNITTDEVIEKECSFHDTEYDYRENKRSFEFIFEDDTLDNYYIIYSIRVYDISGNSSDVYSKMFVDRDSPTISLSSMAKEESSIQVNYAADSPVTQYNESYLTSGFRSSVVYVDNINKKIDGNGASNKNPESYIVSYKKFDFSKTYYNYIKQGNSFVKVEDGLVKDSAQVYYVLVEDTGDYILRGNSGECEAGYCYIVDDRNYYPSLLKNEDYWLDVTQITNEKISVYRIEYQAYDQYGHYSGKIYQTIYIVDTTAPQMKLNGVQSDATTGEHFEVNITFENEKEAVWDRYNCASGNYQCALPGEIFTPGNADLVKYSDPINSTVTLPFVLPGMYKIYFYDSGNYISSTAKDGANEERVMTLKYNYKEYTFIIDQTPPSFSITAKKDLNEKMYYEVVLQGDEKLYCMIDSRMSTISSFIEGSFCQNTMSAYKTSIKEETIGGIDVIVYSGYNSNNDLIYETQYERVGTGQKYFFYSYYKREGNNFSKYDFGDPELNDISNENVYRITKSKLYFRNDGTYAIRAKDAAGNISARDLDVYEWESNRDVNKPPMPTYSTFVIDNTAPIYNKSQNTPTGANFWYSVPSVVIGDSNASYIHNVGNPTGGHYNILGSTLNDSFFYAFATEEDAQTYLIGIYTEHINAQTNTTCPSGAGFYYRYFDPQQKAFVSKCFVDEKNVSHKSAAINQMTAIVKGLIYRTFSGELLFGNASIRQGVCDETNSYCNNSIYKYVYLQKSYSASGEEIGNLIREKCVADYYAGGAVKTECIKVRVQIMKKGSSTSYYLGADNTVDPDSYSMTIHTNAPGSTDSPTVLTSGELFLTAGAYYVFEEKDTTVRYNNPGEPFAHYNTSYYAIYVDNSDYLSVYYEDDEVNGDVNLINSNGSGGVLTNHNKFDLILKKEADESLEAFLERYEILETRDENGDLIEVHSYIRLIINGVYYNINDTDYFIAERENGIITSYYYRIPIVNVDFSPMKERVVEVYFIDRVGNRTWTKISHSQTPPSIKVGYSGEGKDQIVRLELADNTITDLDPYSIEVFFSSNRNGYSDSYTENIVASLKCDPGKTGYLYGCINVGTINNINTYSVNISNIEGLIGFFKVRVSDNHGNSSELEFVYNPANMDSRYTSSVKYINEEIEKGAMGDKRVITKQDLGLEWNNELNYVILYKQIDGEFVEVCNSRTYGTSNHVCGDGSNENNRVESVWENTLYVRSKIIFEDEGLYKAEIINRASIVINSVCVGEDGVFDACKEIKTATNNGCNWTTNANRCAEGYDILVKDVVMTKDLGSKVDSYYLIEVDKTAPTYDLENDFSVRLPSGITSFENGGEYNNGSVTINWYEPGVTLHYSCSFINPIDVGDRCPQGYVMFGSATQFTDGNGVTVATKTLGADINKSAIYTIYFTDYIGNTTEGSDVTFKIAVQLPEVAVYEVYENGNKVKLEPVNGKFPKIKNNIELVCYENSTIVNCDTYYVELYKNGGLVPTTYIVETANEQDDEYEYKVYIKDVEGKKYNENLMVSSGKVKIDKLSPTITISGSADPVYNFYKGEVSVEVTDGTGMVYGNCVTFEDNGNKVYACDDEPLSSFEAKTTVKATGTYKVVAVDDIGNITVGDKIKYFTIDNDKPNVTVVAATEHSDSGYDLAENGFTNAARVIVKGTDNNEGIKIKYCLKTGEADCQWIDVAGDEVSFTDEGLYRVKVIDAVGNESYEKSFKIYRQKPTYTLKYVGSGYEIPLADRNKVLKQSVAVTWIANPNNELEAPIIKVTMNGKNYNDSTAVSETGEYVFMLVDLAGNISTFKISINTSDKICLDGVCLKPNVSYQVDVNEILSFSAEEKYKFKKDDVFIFATPTNAYGGSSECISGVFNYKSLLDKKSFVVISENQANNVNASRPANPYKLIRLNQEEMDLIKELGGTVYIFVVDYDVATKDLGFKIGENFFSKDPLGWSLIFAAGAGLLYVGFKLVFFKKRVRVLK